MELIAPVGRVYHAGTLSGNPVSVRAGYETINYLFNNRETFYKNLEEKTQYLVNNIKELASKYNVPVCVNTIGSLFTIFFTDRPEVKNLEDALSSNMKILQYILIQCWKMELRVLHLNLKLILYQQHTLKRIWIKLLFQ